VETPHTDTSDPVAARRVVLKGLGLSAAAFLSPSAAQAFELLKATGALPKLVFLNAEQFALVDALSERIIPTDASSPGARAARVADFVDLWLSEQEAQLQDTWRDGLAAFDELARRQHAQGFAALAAEQQDQLLEAQSRNEGAPQTALERFFAELKQRTIEGYYTSEIGIHQELRYKGNQFLREFVGYGEQA